MGDTADVTINSSSDPPPSQLPPDPTPPSVEEIVTSEILEAIVKGYNVDYELEDYTAELGSKIGDNYMSIMYSVKMRLKNRVTGSIQPLSVMLKTMPRNAWRIQMINDMGAFVKEAQMYEKVIPDMIAFQKVKGVPDSIIVKSWPSCYTTFNDGKTDYLAMEDLRDAGYRMGNRLKGLDSDHTVLILRHLARFHAVSFAMFQGDYDSILTSYPFLEERMFLPEQKVQEAQKLYLKGCFESEADSLEKAGLVEGATLLRKVYNPEFWTQLNKLVGQKVDRAVITHGDCWTNNFLFKYDESTTPPTLTGLKLIDFQLSRPASRCIDLGYFFHSSPKIELYSEREEDWLRIYHDEFNGFLEQRLGVCPEDHGLTWDSFLQEYDSFRFYGVVMGLMLAPMLSAAVSDIPDMESIREEDFTNAGASEFLDKLIGDLSITKIRNLAHPHLARCREMNP